MRQSSRSLLLLVVAVLLTACSAEISGSGDRADVVLTSDVSANTAETAPGSGISVESAGSSPDAGSRGTGEVTVTGTFGEPPVLQFPNDEPPAEFEVGMLGTGGDVTVGHESVEEGDTVVVNYQGHIWGNDVPFDSSFSIGQPLGFIQGNLEVIAGWDQGLLGAAVGSRIQLIIPPDLAYGPDGNSAAGIGGTDVLLFVVDVLAAFPMDQFGDGPDDSVSTPETLPSGIEVYGEPGSAPSLSIAAGTAEPTAITVTILNFGSGPVITDRPIYLQFAISSWDGTVVGSSWDSTGPSRVEMLSDSPELAGLIGLPVGSRVVITVPPDTGAGEPSSLVVLDAVYQP